MDKILKDSEGNIVRAKIISSVPDGFEDITHIVVNPEKLEEVSIGYLTLQTIPAVEEVQTQPEYWSNGTDTVYDADDIPTIEDENGDAILDPAFVRTPAVEYVAPEPQKYRLVKKNGTDAAIAQAEAEKVLAAARKFGDDLVTKFGAENMILGITQDGMTKTVRQAMAEITNALITGSLYDAIDEIDAMPAESKDGKYITDERLQAYKTKIQEYLGV